MWESPLLQEEDSFTLVAWERKFQDKRIQIHRMIIKNPAMKKDLWCQDCSRAAC